MLLVQFTAKAQGLFESSFTESSSEKELSSANIFSGYTRASVWGGSKNYDFAGVFGEFSLKSSLPKGKAFLSADIRIRDGLFFNERKTILEVKEAYAAYRGNNFDFFAGNQIVSWGRTDGFNPTNNINPNDYFFLSFDQDDQIISNFMLRSKYRFSRHTELEALIIPLFKPSIYHYELFDMGEGSFFTDAVLPSVKLKNASLAARFNVELPKIGFSLSWFHGYDPFYGFDVKNIELMPDPKIAFQADFFKKDVIGLDFAIPVSSFIFRGEFAYNITSDYEDKMFIPNPFLFSVIGIERDFAGLNTILQYVGRYTFDYKELQAPVLLDPMNPMAQYQYAQDLINYESILFNRKIFNQQKELNHGLLLSFNKSFMYDILNAELAGFYDFTSEEYLIRSRFSWNISDGITAYFGFSIMEGPDNSVFNKAGKILSGAFSGLKLSF